jgi:hypothetical protein
MSASDEDFVSIKGAVASTHRLPDRSISLTREALESARADLLAGVVPSLIDHDSRRSLGTTITDAEVRQEDDGEYSLVVTMSMPRSDYERIGARGAFSVAFPELGVPGWPSPENPDVVMLVDSYHWDDAAILEALESFSGSDFSVGGGRYHQFAVGPPAKIVFELLANYKDIPAAVLAAYMVDGIRVLLRRRRKNLPAQQAPDEVAGPVSEADNPDAFSAQAEQAPAEIPQQVPVEIIAPAEDADDSTDSPTAKVTLEFKSDVRRVSIDCDASEPSAQLLERIVRALAEVTPISDDQDETGRPQD